MVQTLIVLTYLFILLGGISALLLRVRFTRKQRDKHPILKKLDGKQLHLLFTTIAFWLVAYGAHTFKDIWSVKPMVEFSQGPRGELTQKATLSGFKKELEEAAAERVSEAEDYFNAAERDLLSNRYKDAANNYKKSINILPTMSAYLNLGISLIYVTDYLQAEDILISGIQIARKKADQWYEGAFLGNIGSVYSLQAKVQDALASYQAALKIHKQIGDPLGEANDLASIGITYAMQGKNHESLYVLKKARTIYLKLGVIAPGLRIVQKIIKHLNNTMKRSFQ